MGIALPIVLELLSDANFMIRKWLAARQNPDIQIQSCLKVELFCSNSTRTTAQLCIDISDRGRKS